MGSRDEMRVGRGLLFKDGGYQYHWSDLAFVFMGLFFFFSLKCGNVGGLTICG